MALLLRSSPRSDACCSTGMASNTVPTRINERTLRLHTLVVVKDRTRIGKHLLLIVLGSRPQTHGSTQATLGRLYLPKILVQRLDSVRHEGSVMDS